jgi:hypothetical protein
MNTGFFIRGAWAGKKWGAGPFFFRFPITDRQTAYEWAMALADRHPYPSWFSVGFGDIRAQTAAGMRARRRALETVSPLADAIYRELGAEFEAGRLVPLKRAYCADNSDVLDFTNCMFELGPVLDLVRRRGDGGWLIGKLLQARDSIATHTTPPEPTTPADQLQPTTPALLAIDWMRCNFKKGDKRDPAIKDCCAQTRATWREALEAYDQLPQNLKRTRGRRDHSR